jgi:hypothetical protein
MENRDHQRKENSRAIATARCAPYACEAAFFIKSYESGKRALVVRYDENYVGPQLPTVDGQRQFETGVPDDWSERDVMDLLLWPMKDPNAPYPAWEVPARAYGSATLFRWWAGEKPS